MSMTPEQAAADMSDREYGPNWDIVPAQAGMRVVEMHCCGFTFDAAHTDEPDGGYTCPLCEPDKTVAYREAVEKLNPWLTHPPAEPYKNCTCGLDRALKGLEG